MDDALNSYYISRMDERQVMIWFGIIGMMVARVFMFPIGSGVIPTGNPATSPPFHVLGTTRNQACQGQGGQSYCAWDWCLSQPQLNQVQFFIGFLAVFLAYPFCTTICLSLFSKVIGPRPQVRPSKPRELCFFSNLESQRAFGWGSWWACLHWPGFLGPWP